jgi:hypothetical protein
VLRGERADDNEGHGFRLSCDDIINVSRDRGACHCHPLDQIMRRVVMRDQCSATLRLVKLVSEWKSVVKQFNIDLHHYSYPNAIHRFTEKR